MLLAHVVERWRYAPQAAGGSTAAEDAPAAPYPSQEHFLLPVTVGRPAGWRVDLPPPSAAGADDLRCHVAFTVFSFELAASPTWAPYLYSAVTAPAARTAECALGGRLEPAGTPSPTPAAGPSFRLLYRCGVLLALDAATQHLFPGVPTASPHEAQRGDQLLPS